MRSMAHSGVQTPSASPRTAMCGPHRLAHLLHDGHVDVRIARPERHLDALVAVRNGGCRLPCRFVGVDEADVGAHWHPVDHPAQQVGDGPQRELAQQVERGGVKAEAEDVGLARARQQRREHVEREHWTEAEGGRCDVVEHRGDAADGPFAGGTGRRRLADAHESVRRLEPEQQSVAREVAAARLVRDAERDLHAAPFDLDDLHRARIIGVDEGVDNRERLIRHSRVRGNPGRRTADCGPWIPAQGPKRPEMAAVRAVECYELGRKVRSAHAWAGVLRRAGFSMWAILSHCAPFSECPAVRSGETFLLWRRSDGRWAGCRRGRAIGDRVEGGTSVAQRAGVIAATGRAVAEGVGATAAY